MVILTARISTSEIIADLARAVTAAARGGSHVCVHAVGLPSYLSASRDRQAAETLVAAVRDVGASVWNGGWSGASAKFLRNREVSAEAAWGARNAEHTGLAQLFEKEPEAVFLRELGVGGARAIAGGSTTRAVYENRANRAPIVCAGYARGAERVSRATVGAARRPARPAGDELWFLCDGSWYGIPAEVVLLEALSRTGGVLAHGGHSIRHVVLGASGMRESVLQSLERITPSAPHDTESEIVRWITGHPWARRNDAADAPALRFSSVPRETGPAFDPSQLAALKAERARAPSGADADARVLKIASSAAPAVSARRHTRYDPFAHRELQGGVTGDMHLENAGVHVVLRAGRVSGISVDPLGPIDLRGRGSGFVQSASGGAGVPALTTYLETHTSAWFTSDSERGVHETAELAGVFHIETTVFAPEDHGGVVLNVRVQRIGPPPNGLIRISPIEVALAVSVPGSESSRTRVFVRDSDEAIESDDLADGGAELSGTAVGLGRDGPAMWLIPIDPDGIPIAPFSFSGGRTAGRHGEPAILWRPLGYAETPDDPIFSCREWTASYRILAGDRPPEISSTPEEIARSIDGFTALGLADRP